MKKNYNLISQHLASFDKPNLNYQLFAFLIAFLFFAKSLNSFGQKNVKQKAVNCMQPEFSICPSDIIDNTALGECSNIITYNAEALGESTYEFSGATTGSGNGTGTGSTFNSGITTVLLTATSSCGSSATCTFTVEIIDNEAPTPPDLSEITGSCGETTTVPYPTATDACGGTVRVETSDLTEYSVAGNYTITWYFYDENNNSSSATQAVSILDTTPPTPPDLSEITGSCGETTTVPYPTATDACGGTVRVETGDLTEYSVAGNYTITWYFYDENNNSSSATQVVSILDTTPPTPPDLSEITGSCGEITTIPYPVATDACGGTVRVETSDLTEYSVAGNYTITWYFYDENNNSSSATQAVSIIDTTPPIPPDLSEITGSCGEITTIPYPIATDACGGTVRVETSDVLEYSVAGNYTITWYFYDENNNSSSATQTVTINPLFAIITSDPESGQGCVGDKITLTGSGGTEFSWNGTGYTTNDKYEITATGETYVTLKVKDESGCESAENDKYVYIYEFPTAVISPDAENGVSCEGKTVILTAKGGDSYKWNDGDFENVKTYLVTTNESVTLTVKNDAGCVSEPVSKQITFNPVLNTIPSATASGTLTFGQETNIFDFRSQNCELIAMILVNYGPGSAKGRFGAKVWLDAPLAGPLVGRHYQIGPVTNEGGTNGRTNLVKLYFTQAEFDAYNAADNTPNTTDNLPTGPTDTGGISRLRIVKYSGESSDGTGLPTTYTEGSTTINPDDDKIIFENGRWSVSFPVNSFSGFFVNSQIVPLPVTLVSFNGKKQNNANLLEWKTANEKAFDGFEIQRSEDGKAFAKIGFVKGENIENYQFIDSHLSGIANYYRLKMVDLDGSSEFSKVIFIENEAEKSTVGDFYPNPAFGNEVSINITSGNAKVWTITSYDLSGKVINTETRQLVKGENKLKFDSKVNQSGISIFRFESTDGVQFRKLSN